MRKEWAGERKFKQRTRRPGGSSLANVGAGKIRGQLVRDVATKRCKVRTRKKEGEPV